MSGPKARIKKGNIALFVVLVSIGVYVFNKKNIDQKLIDVGLLEKNVAVEKKAIETEADAEEKTADFEAENKKIAVEEKEVEIPETKSNKAHIATKADVFFLNEENPIQVSVDGVEGKDFSILVEGRDKVIEIATLDKNEGTYNVKALKKGKVSLSVMAKIDGKIDLIKTQEFEAISRADYAKRQMTTNSINVSNQLEYVLPNSNIMFVGIDNELFIKSKNNNLNNLQIKATNAEFKKMGEKFLINPNSKGNVSIQVFDGSKKIEQRNFAAQSLPTPLPAISGRSGGSISAAVLQRASRLDLLENEQNIGNSTTFTLISYEIMRYSPMSSSTGKAKNTGANFNNDVRRLVSQATVNDLFYFTNIEAKLPNGKTIVLPSIGFDVK